LKPIGSIYLHCDPTASHYLKAVMDAIFGWRKFQTEITWKRTYAHGDRVFSSVSDTILFYGAPPRITDAIRVPLNPEYVQKHFRHNDARGRYQAITLNGPKVSAGESGSPWRGVDPSLAGRCWSPPKTGRYAEWIEDEVIAGYRNIPGVHARLEALYEAGLIHWPGEPSGTPRLKRYLRPGDGQLPANVWTDINPVAHQSNERRGYPTQKPLALYERMILASSNEGDVVCDPFAGCATTLVAAEKLQRQWVGMDIWEGAHRLVVERLKDTTGLFGEVTFTAEPPERTDDGETAAPYLRVKERVKEPEGPVWSRAEMYDYLLTQHGPRCQGCDRVFDDPRYLELDHNTPRSDGGLNHVSNRVLLCGPCNRLKSNTFTLSGLRWENQKRGYMALGSKA
ncbi:MAG: hypothetical protein F4160_13790, partial [Rhodospirillaceae bacterium]|nr:hypothetical protein [Rhodospirillaceae bacterium]